MSTPTKPFAEGIILDARERVDLPDHVVQDTSPISGRFVRAGEPDGTPRISPDAAAAAREAAPFRGSIAPVAVPPLDPAGRSQPRTIERALLEIALVPQAGWSHEQAEAFRVAAVAGRRSPADVVEIVEFLRSWGALPKTTSAAQFACELLASPHSVEDLKNSVSGVWSYNQRQARALGVPLVPAHEAVLVRAALRHARRGREILLLLDAVDNTGGFHEYPAQLRLQALEAALGSDVSPQLAAQWAFDARSIGIDQQADVEVFIRLLSQP